MWIAKPIAQLSEAEQIQWEQIPERPLSQTLAWARAIDAISGLTYLVFSPDEEVGGIVFGIPNDGKIQFECINGPVLNWDNSSDAPRQLATFALATSKLNPHFHSLVLRPRWTDRNAVNRLGNLPIEAAVQTSAATLVLQLKPSKEEQLRGLSYRMQRTLASSWKDAVTTKWERLSLPLLKQFVPPLTAFGKSHGFVTPPLEWFQALTQDSKIQTPHTPSFWLITSEKQTEGRTQARTQILIGKKGDEAYYLFGHEDRLPELRSAVSTSATAHWEAIAQCARMGTRSYDFNGYICEPQPEDPYFGVCQFKKQFAGEIIRYIVPEFRIQ